MVKERLENHFGATLQKSRLYVSELLRQLEPTKEPTVGIGKKSLWKLLKFS